MTAKLAYSCGGGCVRGACGRQQLRGSSQGPVLVRPRGCVVRGMPEGASVELELHPVQLAAALRVASR
jgi:hypothetical protein